MGSVPNPRNEADVNELNVTNESLLSLGLVPTTLSDELMEEVKEIAVKYKDRLDRSKIRANRRGVEKIWTIKTFLASAHSLFVPAIVSGNKCAGQSDCERAWRQDRQCNKIQCAPKR